MKLSARPLIEVDSVNDFDISQQVEFTVGDPLTFYFQLVNLEKNRAQYGWNPPGMRYMPAVGATLALTFLNIDNAKQFTRYAFQPFAQDSSIWAVAILSSDPVGGTVNVKAVLSEGSTTTTFSLHGALTAAGQHVCKQ
jgi:hypothetical protein